MCAKCGSRRDTLSEGMNLKHLFLWAFFIWGCAGAVWLFPKKYRLMKRVGFVNNDELIRLAKDGDAEALQLQKYSKIFIVVGISLLAPLYVISR